MLRPVPTEGGQAPRRGPGWVSHCPSRPGPKSKTWWAPGRRHPPQPGPMYWSRRLLTSPGPGQTVQVGRGRGCAAAPGPRVGGAVPLPQQPAAADGRGRSQVLPGKRSSSAPCPTETPLFLASQLLSEKVHIDLRAAGQDNCLLQSTATSKGGPPAPQTSLGSQDILGRGSRPEMEGQSPECSGEWGLPRRRHRGGTGLRPTWTPSRASAVTPHQPV